ncbi:GNAT family N-acetyltransferase [Ensifer aridi]|uniref:GNAT family N-acetyltransferase n=1 Tax=Ensifer aridi TaxID=1708715 RepID=UPI001FDA68E1|nr:GNAT family N-acetyltransferase [Ensifer aridi]
MTEIAGAPPREGGETKMSLETERLLLREWEDDDLDPLSKINDDPRVVRYVAQLPSREAVQKWILTQKEHFSQHGYGLWALERLGVEGLIGFCGIVQVPYHAHFTPAVEIAWRLAPSAWGHGFATEAASAAMSFGFKHLGLKEIVANAAIENSESRRVMERLGMTHDPRDDFDHPLKAADDPLRHQVLYRMKGQDWINNIRFNFNLGAS